MSPKLIRSACAAIFVAGIAGMIVSSIKGNNNGWVVTFGITTAVASIVLLAVSAATSTVRVDVFEEAEAESLEREISSLVGAGADETAVRSLVRDALRVARRR